MLPRGDRRSETGPALQAGHKCHEHEWLLVDQREPGRTDRCPKLTGNAGVARKAPQLSST